MRRIALSLWLVGMLVAAAIAGQLTGTFEAPTGAPLVGATLELTLSQFAVVPDSFALVPTPVYCYTTAAGKVVGVPDPAYAPVLTPQPGLGTLPAGTYYLEVTNYGASGESLPSPVAVVTLTAQGSIALSALGDSQGDSTAIYAGATEATMTRQSIITGGTASVAAPLISGASAPASNTTPCTLQFNDATVPAPTYYTAVLKNANGTVEPGFPLEWYLSGPTENVASLQPLSTPPGMWFGDPVLQNGTGYEQSINSALNLNGYQVHDAPNLGPGLVSFFWSGALPAPNATIFTWTPENAINLERGSAFAETPGNGGTTGAELYVTNGTASCNFYSEFLPGAAAATSWTISTCSNEPFAAGVPVSVEIIGDDHVTKPSNVSVILEVTSN